MLFFRVYDRGPSVHVFAFQKTGMRASAGTPPLPPNDTAGMFLWLIVHRNPHECCSCMLNSNKSRILYNQLLGLPETDPSASESLQPSVCRRRWQTWSATMWRHSLHSHECCISVCPSRMLHSPRNWRLAVGPLDCLQTRFFEQGPFTGTDVSTSFSGGSFITHFLSISKHAVAMHYPHPASEVRASCGLLQVSQADAICLHFYLN